MKIAILGGGFTGLTTAYYLAKKGYQITIYEKESILGGLASGFKVAPWDWYLERSIHHIFANDGDILNFAKEVGFNQIFFKEPETASLYKISNFQFPTKTPDQRSVYDPTPNEDSGMRIAKPFTYHQQPVANFCIFPLDTPYDLLQFPLLSPPQKLRTGLVLAFLKFSPFLKFYEEQTATDFLKKTMGKEAWNILWQPLFRKKFGKYAGKILSSFIWARIKKRTKRLGYIEGGFQNFINFLVKKLKSLRVNVLTDWEIGQIKKRGEKYIVIGDFTHGDKSNQQEESSLSTEVGENEFDMVISTLPTPILIKIGKNLFPADYLSKLKKIKYLHAVSLILETNQPILQKTYWLNIVAPEIPIMGIFQQTNFVNKRHYGGRHICYFGWYVDEKDKLWQMSGEEILDFVKPYLKAISNFQFPISNYYLFKSPFAQPIFDKDFIKNKPDFETPLKNFYIANLDMTYPFDRGTNYAVKLGKTVVELIHEKKGF